MFLPCHGAVRNYQLGRIILYRAPQDRHHPGNRLASIRTVATAALLSGTAGLLCGWKATFQSLTRSHRTLMGHQKAACRRNFPRFNRPQVIGIARTGGEGGIRTLGTGVSPYNGLANRRIRPLCHLSGVRKYSLPRSVEGGLSLQSQAFTSPLPSLHPLSQARSGL